jgi:hypothetical protein
MIEAASIAHQPQDISPRRKDTASREDTASFSYALAEASLEKNAARSLEAHGAKPNGAAAASRAQSSRKPQTDGAQPAAKNNGEAAPPRPANAARSEESPKAAPANQASAQTNVSTIASVERAAPYAVNGQFTLQTKSADVAVLRDAAASKAKSAAPKAPRLPATPAALKTEFAEILARRLEKTSVFDLRLDPPEIGRIEGRLSVKDDGKSVLSLTFDNQSAFDLFSRDEQALRHALQQAGLQFGAGDFIFAFRERPQPEGDAADFAAVSALDSAAAYEPVFTASWSAGALDIRI